MTTRADDDRRSAAAAAAPEPETGGHRPSRRRHVWRVLASLLACLPLAARAESSGVRLGIQPGLSYLAFYVVEREQLIEHQAAAAGLGDIKTGWVVSANGTVITDAVLSSSIDLAATGIPPFITLWAKGRGAAEIRGLAGYGSVPAVLVTRNPAVRTIADFTAADRIAVPSVRASVQAIILEMATARTFGADNWGRLDPLTVSLGHPDALVAMLSGRSEITAHFAPAPFYQQELQAPGTHVVLRTDDVFGGPLSNGILWTTTRFHSEHQEIVRSVLAALEDAMTLIHHDPRRAAEDYLALSKDKPGVAELTEMIRELDASFDTVPHGTKAVADFMHRIGAINVAPARWQDMFFPEAWTRPGS